MTETDIKKTAESTEVVASDATEKPTFLKRLWPITSLESKKLNPLLLMMFCICFSYTLLRDLKDVLIYEIGNAELIPNLKLLFTLPFSIIFMMVYTKLTIKYSKPQVFYGILFFFLISFFLIGISYGLYYRGAAPSTFRWHESFPVGAQLFLAPLEHWPITLIFIFAELYGSVVLSLLFWGFANDICLVNEAGRFYPLINMAANVSLTILGTVLIFADNFLKHNKELFTYLAIGCVIVFGLLVAYVYRHVNAKVLTDPRLFDASKVKGKKSKAKLGFKESLKVVFGSAYIRKIAALVVMYGLAINFLEIFYKNVFKMMWVKSSILGKGLDTLFTGLSVIVLSLAIGSTAVKRFGWTITALLTPSVLGVFGFIFLVIQWIFKNQLIILLDNLKVYNNLLDVSKKAGTTPPSAPDYGDNGHIILPLYILGFIAVVCAKSFKYTFFDPTKELAYIPLDDDVRAKAKAAVDVVGARFGKSGASLIFMALNPAFNNKSLNYVYLICVFFALGMSTWIYSDVSLGRDFARKAKESEEEQVQLEENKPKESI